MTVVRYLLGVLSARDPLAITRLCCALQLSGRARSSQLSSLVRHFGDDVPGLLKALSVGELRALLRQPTRLGQYTCHLPGTGQYSSSTVRRMAEAYFSRGEIPVGFEVALLLNDETETLTEEVDAHPGYTSAEYKRQFHSDVAFRAEVAEQPLRPYQEEAVKTVLAALNPGDPQLLHLATGGGKTRAANAVVRHRLQGERRCVLWITKDWRLLKQAAEDAGQRYPRQKMMRLGGSGSPLHPLQETTGSKGIVYSTVQTVGRRLGNNVLAGLGPQLVVWDECHWGEHSKSGEILAECRRLGIPVLGLTATPRSTSLYTVAYSKTFWDLVNDGHLARPEVREPVRTGVRWRPTFRGGSDDVSAASLRELARDKRRNRMIVEHYASCVKQYGKTIFFACNIEHANELVRLLVASGFAARPIHSGQSEAENQQALVGFRSGAVTVLVNVEQLTHGIDVPDAMTVFLCRPTTSDILFAQMVGRAARQDESSGKTTFNIVEFTDNVTAHGELLRSAQQYFTGAGGGAEQRSADSIRPSARTDQPGEHRFDPLGAPTWIPVTSDVPVEIPLFVQLRAA